MDNTLYWQMMQMLEGLKRPEGVLYMGLVLVLAALTIGVRSMHWILMALLLYICTFGVSGWTGLTLASPLQQLRLYGRGTCRFSAGADADPDYPGSPRLARAGAASGARLHLRFPDTSLVSRVVRRRLRARLFQSPELQPGLCRLRPWTIAVAPGSG